MNARQINQWVWVANVGLAVAIFVFATVFILIPPKRDASGATLDDIVVPNADEASDAPRRPNLDFYKPIWKWCEKIDVPTAAQTHPPLDTLLGIQGLKENRKDPKRSCAFVTLIRTRETKNAYIGDTLEGAKVTAIIGPDTVEFDYYGSRVKLTMLHGAALPSGTGLGGRRAEAGSRSGAKPATPTLEVPDYRKQNFQTKEDPNAPGHWLVDPREKEFILSNDAGILNQVEWHPYRTPSGQMSGMMIDKIQDSSIIAGRGFKQGDIIRTVDGNAINSFEQAQQLMKDSAMRGKSSVVIEVERGGRPFKMQFDVR
ncbi:MAG: hypothetical protein HYY93_13455 [Planctomycetes bacterium]|nr:hypothetical protein [Planctomycetota bacterium]